MTIEEKWAKLSPRERDAWVAENVMGLSKPSWQHAEHSDYPRYSTDIAAAWEVLNRFIAWQISELGKDGIKVVLGVQSPGVEFHPVSAFGETAPHAICLAALKAKNVQ